MKTSPFLLYWLPAFLLLLFGTTACDTNSGKMNQHPYKYPETLAVDTVVDNFFGKEVSDPFRWLEDDNSEATAQWVTAQNQVTDVYLKEIPYREAIRQRMEQLWDYEKYSAPSKQGNYYFFSKNDGLQNQSVLYRQTSLEGEPEVFLDPNTFSEDGTIAWAGGSFSDQTRFYAYFTTTSGSDWRTIYVMDVESKALLEDKIDYAKFTGVAWKGDEGFFYSTYDRPKEGEELSGMNMNHKVYFHKLGTPQRQDELVYGGNPEEVARYVGAGVTEDQRFLVVSRAISTSGNALVMKDLTKPNSKWVTVVDNYDNDHYLAHNEGDKLFFVTDLGAPNSKIVTADFSNPTPGNWQDFIPEQPDVLSYASFAGGKVFAGYIKDANTKVFQYNMQGEQEKEVILPALGSASGFGGKKEDTQLFYSFSSFTYPNTIYAYDIATGQSTVFRQPKVDFDPADYETKQVFYKSKDGTKVPMFIVHKKGLALDGQNPTYLYSYGGFNISLLPGFSVSRLYWLERGGVFAMPNIRGGGEYGKAWHEAGTKMSKQNVFDDFIAAAEYLIAEKYTSSEKLALFGGSNGGLLVGATMTQRPELAKVAVPAVGVLDMLRYHKFTAGAGWIYDYGCADSSQAMFDYLYAYSPVHNVKEGVAYPATLVKTADHDDRVVPAHSFKFIAELQRKQAGDNPVMIRIDTKAGHGGGKPTAKVIEEWADTYAFVYKNLGFNPYTEDELIKLEKGQ